MEAKEHPEWKELLAKFKDSEWGALIPHQTIEGIIGFSRTRQANKYYQIVNRWKKAMLEDAGKYIECLNSKGYEVIRPEGFRKSCVKQMAFGKRRYTQAGKILVKTPVELLSEDEQKKVGETNIVLSQILHFSKETMKAVRKIDKKTDKLLLDVGNALDVGD